MNIQNTQARISEIHTKTEELLRMKEAALYKHRKEGLALDKMMYIINDINAQVILLQAEYVNIQIRLFGQLLAD